VQEGALRNFPTTVRHFLGARTVCFQGLAVCFGLFEVALFGSLGRAVCVLLVGTRFILIWSRPGRGDSKVDPG
jgi:hypothetical protein